MLLHEHRCNEALEDSSLQDDDDAVLGHVLNGEEGKEGSGPKKLINTKGGIYTEEMKELMNGAGLKKGKNTKGGMYNEDMEHTSLTACNAQREAQVQ
mmetsp:Transcript_27652/g.74837  ORF Transcript_27652/g.74837 Transcript_27652/m.74837 type:complete len:97 (+) Transcript_27652:529-819(+)|eukprot:CAMPEP_0202391132 /NCGR_PEP_ID=MMETSP1127-20130417/91671_1 /ASSEMBLY_ACC=CAM_ASM_000462 /TAXON_ID=3047 /ORGANISM="Dunaliella tertiolecta, Strain CCMP1320" /LENGTH=96 /DNA_ID=CAMNT_0048993543 /DNA_START=2737 /DNA_END=3027 /DNA_ORIENTATION=-